jgi:hypothetical protein
MHRGSHRRSALFGALPSKTGQLIAIGGQGRFVRLGCADDRAADKGGQSADNVPLSGEKHNSGALVRPLPRNADKPGQSVNHSARSGWRRRGQERTPPIKGCPLVRPSAQDRCSPLSSSGKFRPKISLGRGREVATLITSPGPIGPAARPRAFSYRQRCSRVIIRVRGESNELTRPVAAKSTPDSPASFLMAQGAHIESGRLRPGPVIAPQRVPGLHNKGQPLDKGLDR